MLITLKAGDVKIPAHLAGTALRTSRHTGAPLTVMTVTIESRSTPDNAFLDNVAEKRALLDAEFEGAPEGCKWKLENTSYHFTNNGVVRTYKWDLAQTESLRIKEIVLEGIHLQPYKYREEFDGENRLVIHACVRLAENERKALSELPPLFQVTREGVSATPRQMRFGRSVWSATDGETKAELYLIDVATEEPQRGFMEPVLPSLEAFSTYGMVAVNRLLDALHEKGVLDATTIASIRDTAESAANDLRFSRTYGVGDLDAWLAATGEDRKYEE